MIAVEVEWRLQRPTRFEFFELKPLLLETAIEAFDPTHALRPAHRRKGLLASLLGQASAKGGGGGHRTVIALD